MPERKLERDFELASARRALEAAEQLAGGWRDETRKREAELLDAEERLAEAELRAERSEEALAAIRGGRSYRLMRLAWRLRRPFRRR